MKKQIINYIIILTIWCFFRIFSVVEGVSVILPRRWESEDYNPWDVIQKDGSYSLLNIIEFINDYLWFAIWFVCFLFMVINWIKLITSRWDEKETSKAMQALIWCVVWIVICLSAYIIVNIVIRLFA